MFGLNRILASLASVLLLSSSVSAVTTPLPNYAGLSFTVTSFGDPAHTIIDSQVTKTVAANSPAVFPFGPSGPANQATLTVYASGELVLDFKAGSIVPTFDGSELSFASSDPNSPTFDWQVYEIVNPLVSSCLSPGQNQFIGSQLALLAPTVNVVGGSIFFNIFANSVSTQCDVSFTYGSGASETLPAPPPSVNGDPQFTGFVGQSYQIHGVSGNVYNVLSTPSFQLNALFTYLESGKCRKETTCFSHPGNYFGEVGMVLKDEAGVISQLRVIAGSVDAGMKVILNDQPLAISADTVQIGDSSLVFSSAFDLNVQTPEFALKLSNSDMFLNEDIAINTALLRKIQNHKQAVKRNEKPNASSMPHGLLGQTWEYKTYGNRWKFIEGQLFEYVLADGIFSTGFKYNRFVQ